MTTTQSIRDFFYAAALSATRMSMLFTLIPFLGQSILRPMVRHVLVFALTMVLIPVVFHQLPAEPMGLLSSSSLILKEAFLGALMAFFLSIPIWVAGSTGFVIDNQRGLSMAEESDPMLGGSTSPLGMTFTHILVTYFFSAGGFLVMIGLVYESYVMWPIFSFFPKIDAALPLFTLGQFDNMMKLIVLLAAPIAIVMFMCDFGLGLVNRFAPQLNVFVLSMGVKSGVASLLILFYLKTLFDFLRTETFQAQEWVRFLKNVLG